MENQKINEFENFDEVISDVTDECVNNSGFGVGLKIIGGVLTAAGLAYGGFKLVKKIKSKLKNRRTKINKSDYVEMPIDDEEEIDENE